MNFEKCLCFYGENMPNSACYCTKDKSKLSDDVSLIKKKYYPKKILMWVAISNRGMSIPYFRLSKSVAINTEIFINECLQPRLLPFRHKHHNDLNFQFVHDLAGAHFSIETIAKMKENLPFSIIPPFS
jgi:hypothetical protein